MPRAFEIEKKTVIAGIGTLIITIIARLAALIPCVGWTVGAILSLFGLGAIVLTRFGTRDYPLEIISKPASPVQSSASITNQENLDNTLEEIGDLPQSDLHNDSFLD